MKIYIDLIFFMNLFYDYVLLLFLGLLLKRNINRIRILMASLFGSFSILTMFLNINSVVLLLINVLTSIIMIIISYKFISIKYTFNNLLYLYMLSIILAGFLYYLSIHFENYNYLLLVIISPIILLYDYYCHKISLTKYNYYYHIDIFFKDKKISCMSFLDSGNNLYDPVTKKYVIIVSSKLLKGINNIRSPVYVPYNTLNSHSLMKCYKPSYIVINNKKIYNYLIGETNMEFKDGIKALLNNNLRKDNYV